MALSANTVVEVRPTGSDTNGGGFVTGSSGTDWSQQDTPQYSVTDGVTAGTTTITSATANFGTDVVGNLIYVQGGTGSVVAGWYQIISRTNATTIVVDRSTGLTAGTGVTLKIGGALLTLNTLAGILVSGNIAWVKGGTDYTTSTTIAFTGTSVFVIGYTTTRGDNGQFQIKATAGSITLLQSASNAVSFVNAIANGNGQASVTGFNQSGSSGSPSCVDNCKAINCATGISISSGQKTGSVALSNSVIETCTTGVTLSNGGGIADCWIKGCTTGISSGGNTGGFVSNSIISGGTTGISFGSSGSAASLSLIGSVIYGPSGNGIAISNNSVFGALFLKNNIIYGCGGWGIQANTPNATQRYVFGGRNAFGNNTSGHRNNFPVGTGDVTLTADPFTNAASSDFSLNNTAGGGAACIAAGFPGLFAGGLMTGYCDIGPIQHQDSGGGGSVAFPVIGRIVG